MEREFLLNKIRCLIKDHYGVRFLVSFSGKYLAYNYNPESSHSQIEGDSTAGNLDHQLYKIHVPHTEANSFGPAFIEVVYWDLSSFSFCLPLI